MAKVVVIGASTGGLPASYEMKEALGSGHDVTVVSDTENFHFIPSNPWVAVGWRIRKDISFPIKPSLARKGINFFSEAAQKIDPQKNEVTTALGTVVPYDYLIIATGPKLAFDEVMSVEVVRGLKRQEGADAHDQRPEDLVADVEVVVRVAAPLPLQDAVIRILGRVLRLPRPKRGPLLHALQDEVHAEPIAPDHPFAVGSDVILPLETLRFQRLVVGPLDRDALPAREGLDPLPVLCRPLAQGVLGDRIDLVHIPEEVDDVLLPCQ